MNCVVIKKPLKIVCTDVMLKGNSIEETYLTPTEILKKYPILKHI